MRDEDAERLRQQLAATPRTSAARLADALGIDDVRLGLALNILLQHDELECKPSWSQAPALGSPRVYWLKIPLLLLLAACIAQAAPRPASAGPRGVAQGLAQERPRAGAGLDRPSSTVAGRQPRLVLTPPHDAQGGWLHATVTAALFARSAS